MISKNSIYRDTVCELLKAMFKLKGFEFQKSIIWASDFFTFSQELVTRIGHFSHVWLLFALGQRWTKNGGISGIRAREQLCDKQKKPCVAWGWSWGQQGFISAHGKQPISASIATLRRLSDLTNQEKIVSLWRWWIGWKTPLRFD